jgi:tetratricopeptide (TPR) repeat protein
MSGALPGDDRLGPHIARVLQETSAGVPVDSDTIGLLKKDQGTVEPPSGHAGLLGRFLAFLQRLWFRPIGDEDWKSLVAVLSSFASGMEADRQEVACDVLRCIFHGLVRPISLDPSWLTANDSAVVVLAEEVEASGRFDVMPILGDALADAGCADLALLEHCRSAEPHALGCWAIAVIRGEPPWSEARMFGWAVNHWSLYLCCNPDNQYALRQRGFAYSKIGRYDELIEDMNVLLALNPTSAWALGLRGFGYQEKKEYESAMADFHRSLELSPNDAWTHAHIGYVLDNLGQFDQALTSLNRAIEIDPLDGWARSKRGYTHLMKGDLAGAIADFTHALEHCPNYLTNNDRPWAQANRGYLYLLTNRPKKAIEDLTCAIESPLFASSSFFHWAYGQRAAAYLRLADHAQAMKDLEKAVQDKEGMNAFAWSLATSPDASCRDGKRAVELASRACELSSWKNAIFIDTLAAAHGEVGDFGPAVRLQEQAIALGGLDEDAPRRLELYRACRPYRTS